MEGSKDLLNDFDEWEFIFFEIINNKRVQCTKVQLKVKKAKKFRRRLHHNI